MNSDLENLQFTSLGLNTVSDMFKQKDLILRTLIYFCYERPFLYLN